MTVTFLPVTSGGPYYVRGLPGCHTEEAAVTDVSQRCHEILKPWGKFTLMISGGLPVGFMC